MLQAAIDSILVRRALAVAANHLANGSDVDAKRMIRACNMVLQTISEDRDEYETLFRQAVPPRKHQR